MKDKRVSNNGPRSMTDEDRKILRRKYLVNLIIIFILAFIHFSCICFFVYLFYFVDDSYKYTSDSIIPKAIGIFLCLEGFAFSSSFFLLNFEMFIINSERLSL